MKTIKTGFGTVDITDDRYKELFIEEGHICTGAASLDKLVVRVCKVVLVGVERIMVKRGYPVPRELRVLEAHGDICDGEYYYFERSDGNTDIFFPVRDWVRKYEDSHDVLFVSACNPSNTKFKYKPRRAFVVYPLGLNSVHDTVFSKPEFFDILEPEKLLSN